MKAILHLFFIFNTRNRHPVTNRCLSMTKNLVIDPFCYRQFAEHENSRSYGGMVL